MRALILSDLHAITKRDPSRPLPSLIEFANTTRSVTQDPLLGLQHLLASGSVPTPDVIICAGDLADKADANAIRSVWEEINTIARDVSIPIVFATCGNHDLDTRHVDNKFDPKGFLRTLSPPFPNPFIPKNDPIQLSYWADNFCLFEDDRLRILNINSCAYHGYGDKAAPELEHGRISDFTLDNIRELLKSTSSAVASKFNICIFHHHLREISSDQYSDKSRMAGAENLIELLSESRFGEWLVVHGHRHVGDIYQASGISSPIVLSCASFAATPVGNEHNPSPNQFYLVELETPSTGRYRIRGEVRTWSWSPSYGWLPAGNTPGGLPRICGFGFKGDLHDVADGIVDLVMKDGRLKWENVKENFPELKYFLPADVTNLVQIIDASMKISVSRDGREIREIVRI